MSTSSQYPLLFTLYLGDAHADWTSFSVYNKYSTWLGLHPLLTGSRGITWLKNSYNELLMVAPTKPMMLTEFASIEAGDGDAKKAAWITDALTIQIPINFPKIKAAVWMNSAVEGRTYPIEISQAATNAWAAAITSPMYAANQFANLNTSPIPPLVTFFTISGNTSVAGVTLNYTNGTPQSVLSDSSGNYSIHVPSGWSGTVTPSKTGYIFSPTNRTYSNVVANQVAQNYTATLLYSISGNTGVAGMILSYTDGTPRTVTSLADGSYSFAVPAGWSGTVTPTHSCFTFSPASHNYSNLASDQTGQDFTPTLQPGCADVSVLVGGANQGRFGLPSQGSTRASFNQLNNGPVQIVSSNAIPLIAAERVIYKVNNINTSFSEMMGLPNGQLDQIYWLPWYNNVDLDTQLRFANVSGLPTTVHLYIHGTEMTSGCSPSNSPYTLAPGASLRVSCTGINDGPVKIESDQNIVAAERVIYKVNGINTSFSEMMALPHSQLDSIYWLPWYNNIDLDTQLRFGRP